MAELCCFHIVTCMIMPKDSSGLCRSAFPLGFEWPSNYWTEKCIKVPALSQHIHVKSTVDKSSRMAYRLLFPGFFEEFEVIVPIETLVSKESEFA